MSTYTVKHLPTYASVVATVSEKYSPYVDMPNLVDEVLPILESSPNRMWLILDFTLMKLTVDDLIHATDASIRGPGTRVLKHRNCKACIVVSPSPMWDIAVKGLRSDAFGRLNCYAYRTVDEALANIQERLRSQMEAANK